MSQDTYWVLGWSYRFPDNPVKVSIEASTEAGLTTSVADGTDTFDKYKSGRHEIYQSEGGYDIETVRKQITEDGSGELYFCCDSDYVTIEFPEITPDTGSTTPTILLRVSKASFFNLDVKTLVRWIGEIAVAFDVDYMIGCWDYQLADVATKELAELKRIPWVVVLSSERIEELGGRVHVRETPAWKVEELETGHIVIVRSNNPLEPTEKPTAAPERHLLGE